MHAIGLAAANPKLTAIALAAGTYSSATGELFPYAVPANITIAGPAGCYVARPVAVKRAARCMGLGSTWAA
jgi:hypothetical protein